MFARRQKPLNILTVGDSLTAGYHKYGQSYHPYSIHLKHLFDSINKPVSITEKGVSGERVVPSMVKRLRHLLEQSTYYDWIIILGGTNDFADQRPAERIFKDGLEPMYTMCLNHYQGKAKLVAMTVIENTIFSPTHNADENRQKLNQMIRDYVTQSNDPDRVFLVDLDRGIPYHSVNDTAERRRIWDDTLHLTAAGYDRMATLVFDEIKDII
ncbi:unnamed protein product [Rotaria magnacalcarata]|uniref:SGNH hydrolase-type esterase domain-containing protein n=4 Tax=Rotaria magnacalcarata TaxID=392030 RepID=A0A815U7C7_9BILA|nr:unnamed protein product [Rotaria magnacalcarata]